MSMLGAVQTYLKTYTELETGAPVWVDFLGGDPTQYSVTPLPGARIISEDIIGNTEREYSWCDHT